MEGKHEVSSYNVKLGLVLRWTLKINPRWITANFFDFPSLTIIQPLLHSEPIQPQSCVVDTISTLSTAVSKYFQDKLLITRRKILCK
jgi:hypothetical protein